jgi:hypothetical protein
MWNVTSDSFSMRKSRGCKSHVRRNDPMGLFLDPLKDSEPGLLKILRAYQSA